MDQLSKDYRIFITYSVLMAILFTIIHAGWWCKHRLDEIIVMMDAILIIGTCTIIYHCRQK